MKKTTVSTVTITPVSLRFPGLSWKLLAVVRLVKKVIARIEAFVIGTFSR